MSKPDTNQKIFKSAVDNWYYIIVVAVPATVLVPIFFSYPTSADYVAIAIALLATGLPIWLLWSTDYRIQDDALLIRSGPFRWRISLSEIQEVEPSRSLLSSPALSIDRLRISYGNNRSILVSPEDKSGFIEAVKNAD